MLTHIKNYFPLFFAVKKELAGLIAAFIVFILYLIVFRSIGIAASPTHLRTINAIIIVVFTVLIFKAVTWWLINNIWPVLGEYSKNNFKNDFNSLTPLQKVIIYLAFYLLIFLSFIYAVPDKIIGMN